MDHRWQDLSLDYRGIDCIEHDSDDKICAKGRLCLTEGDRIHYVLIGKDKADQFYRGKRLVGVTNTDAVVRPKLVI
jgi:hypothetical protein